MKRVVISLWAAAVSLVAAEKPNVLFIAVDDLKPLLGCYGDSQVITPNIDKLAARGTVFLNAHCQQAVCGASRASIMTGLRPDTVGVRDFETKMRDASPGVVTIPQAFKQAGYYARSIGKIYDGRCVDGWGEHDAPSWSEPHMSSWPPTDPQGGYLNAKTRAKREANGDKPMDPPGALNPPVEGSEDVPDESYVDGFAAMRAVEHLKEIVGKKEPFFFAVGFDKPHLPFVAPKKYWEMYQREQFQLAEFQKAPEGVPGYSVHNSGELRYGYSLPLNGDISEADQKELIHGYYACVTYVDAQIGKVLDALEETGVAENTIIVLWGDHGFHLGDHAMFCKHSNYENATRVPLIVAAPKQLEKGSKSSSPVELIDVFPTLTDLAGVKSPDVLEGESLRPLLDDHTAKLSKLAMSQYDRGKGENMRMGYSVRDERYRLTEWRRFDYKTGAKDGPVEAVELFDYQTDPLETKNLAEDPKTKEIVSKLSAEIKKLRNL